MMIDSILFFGRGLCAKIFFCQDLFSWKKKHHVASVFRLWCPVLFDRTWWQVLVVIIDVIQGFELTKRGYGYGDDSEEELRRLG